MILEELAQKYGTDKYEHGYTPHYNRHFGALTEPVSLFEIGVFDGGSLRMWADFFYNRLSIIDGLDIDPRCTNLEFDDPRIEVTIGDVKDFPLPLSPYDIIIDDGSHLASDMVAALDRLWSSVKPGGWYVVEDWLTQWHEVYEGTPLGSTATIRAHDLLDLVLQETGNVSEFHAYPQILFLKKKA